MDLKADEALVEVFGTTREIGEFQNALMVWFRSEGRDYPWRRTKDPYAILVSEAMLQQTQVATVMGRGYFTRWMEIFPSWEALSSATEEEVLKQWEGLGYYNRARNLQKTAKIVVTELGGCFPEDIETMLSLPGVGRYTAGAVASFSFDQRAAIVDSNVSRVFSRLFASPEPVDTPAGRRMVWEWAEAMTPGNEPGLYNSALMELGQRICGRSPDCPACPVNPWCLARQRGTAVEFPRKKAPKKITIRQESVLLAVKDGRVLLCPESGSRRIGLWRLPEISEEESVDLRELFRFDYSITRYRVTLMVFLSPPTRIGDRDDGAEWFAEGSVEKLPPMGSPYRKALSLFSEYRDALTMKG